MLELSQKNFGKRTTFLDLTGKTFKNYTVINESPDRSKGGSVMWYCNCHLCGRFFLMPQTAYKKDNPCNCLWAIRKKEIGARLYKEQVQKFHVEGTFLPLLLKEDNVNNTSGVRGVSFNEKTGRWVAYMSFKGKNVLRKSFECKEEAIRERRKAELFYFRPVLKKYVSEGVL
ncbi:MULTISPECIES: AP2 domain-containing protein [Vagococcus]|nr:MULTISPECIES: AP2 domain-containing protein [Vagococcus]